MVIGTGFAERYLTHDEIRETCARALASVPLHGRCVLVLIPDGTRTMPMAEMFGVFQELLRPRVKALDYLVALGTHQPMTDEQLSKRLGRSVVDGHIGDTHIFNHHWEVPANFVQLGNIPARDRKSTRLNSSHMSISYAVF